MTRDDYKQLVTAIARIGPEELRLRWDERRCIASTNVGIRVCRYFGLKAEPVAVRTLVGNKQFADWRARASMEELAAMTTEEAEALGIWLVEIDTDPERGNGYPGHLVVGLRELGGILDLNTDQFNRPKKGIDIGDGCFYEVHDGFYDDPEQAAAFDGPNGELIAYGVHPDPPDWRHAPDWRRERPNREVAGKIIRRVREEVRGG